MKKQGSNLRNTGWYWWGTSVNIHQRCLDKAPNRV